MSDNDDEMMARIDREMKKQYNIFPKGIVHDDSNYRKGIYKYNAEVAFNSTHYIIATYDTREEAKAKAEEIADLVYRAAIEVIEPILQKKYKVAKE